MLATLLDQFPVTRGQLTPEAFSEWSKQANMQSKHAARLSTQQDICSCSSCCKPLSVSPWQRLALRSRVCARELLPDSLKAVGYLSIMSLCTSFILLHSTSCYFMLHPCISRSANSMWPLLEHCLNTACILQPRYVILRHLSPDNCCNLFIEYTCTAGKRWEKCTVCVTQSMHWQPDSSMHSLPESIIKTSRLPDSLRIRLASGRSLPQCQKVGSSVQSFYILYPLYPHITSYGTHITSEELGLLRPSLFFRIARLFACLDLSSMSSRCLKMSKV